MPLLSVLRTLASCSWWLCELRAPGPAPVRTCPSVPQQLQTIQGQHTEACVDMNITLLGIDLWIMATVTACGRSENWWNCDWWCGRSYCYGGSSNSALWSHDKFWPHQYVGQSSCCNHKWRLGIPGLLRSLRRLAITGWPSFPLYQEGGAHIPMLASAMMGNINPYPEAP